MPVQRGWKLVFPFWERFLQINNVLITEPELVYILLCSYMFIFVSSWRSLMASNEKLVKFLANSGTQKNYEFAGHLD